MVGVTAEAEAAAAAAVVAAAAGWWAPVLGCRLSAVVETKMKMSMQTMQRCHRGCTIFSMREKVSDSDSDSDPAFSLSLSGCVPDGGLRVVLIELVVVDCWWWLMLVLSVTLASLFLLVTLRDARAQYVTSPEQFGAVGDGRSNDSPAVQKALASCSGHKDGCRVIFAQKYLSGPIVVNTSNTTLEISGQLLVLPRKDYTARQNFISTDATKRLSNITVTGPGLVGIEDLETALSWWACKLLGCFRPHLFCVDSIAGVRIGGGLQLHNSPNHNIEVRSCTGTRIDDITVVAPLSSPNTDGVNFYGGHDQSFTNSVVHNGDDCVSVVPIGEFTDACVNGDPTQAACRGGNVVVRNITCVGGHGISIGGVRHGTVSNVTFENITATGGRGNTQGKYSSGGLRVKSYPNSTGEVFDILYSDILLDGVYLPLQLLGRYCPWPCKTPGGNQSVRFHDITFRRIRGTGRSTVQGDFDCSPYAPCQHIVLDDVVLGEEYGKRAAVVCDHADVVFANSTSPSACKPATE